MTHEILTGIVGQDALVTLSSHEADVVQDMFKGFIGVAQRAKSSIQDAAIDDSGIVNSVLQIFPPRAFRDEEAVVVIGIFAVVRLGIIQFHALFDLASDDFFALGLEDIRTAFQEEHSEDVILVGGGVEPLLPQPVGGGVIASPDYNGFFEWSGKFTMGLLLEQLSSVVSQDELRGLGRTDYLSRQFGPNIFQVRIHCGYSAKYHREISERRA